VESTSNDMDESITDLLTCYEYYLLAQTQAVLYEELIDKFKIKIQIKLFIEFKKFVDLSKRLNKMETKLISSFWYLPNQVFGKQSLPQLNMNTIRISRD